MDLSFNLSIYLSSLLSLVFVPLFSLTASLVVLVVFLCNNIWIIEAQQERREWICGRKKHTHTHTHILPQATSRSYIPSAIHVVNENWYIQTEWIRDGMTIESSRECAHGCVSKKVYCNWYMGTQKCIWGQNSPKGILNIKTNSCPNFTSIC